MSNDEKELRGYIKKLLENQQLREDMGKAARQTILEKFSMDTFISNCNNLFSQAYTSEKI